MAISKGNRLLAQDFINLKARVKSEMLRRNRTGSLVAYGSATYDYTETPHIQGGVKTEHYNKLITPLNAIANIGIPLVNPQDVVVSLDALETKLKTFESYPMVGSVSGCAASCSGLCTGCAGTCVGGCTSCAGCTGGCTGSCSSCSGCAGTCTGDCTGSCSSCSGCTGNCVADCRSGCWTSCDTNCSVTCKHGCSGSATRSPTIN